MYLTITESGVTVWLAIHHKPPWIIKHEKQSLGTLENFLTYSSWGSDTIKCSEFHFIIIWNKCLLLLMVCDAIPLHLTTCKHTLTDHPVIVLTACTSNPCQGLLSYDTIQRYGRIPTFRRIMLLPPSESSEWCCKGGKDIEREYKRG